MWVVDWWCVCTAKCNTSYYSIVLYVRLGTMPPPTLRVSIQTLNEPPSTALFVYISSLLRCCCGVCVCSRKHCTPPAVSSCKLLLFSGNWRERGNCERVEMGEYMKKGLRRKKRRKCDAKK